MIPRDRAFFAVCVCVSILWAGMEWGDGTHARLLYASMTMPCLAENSSTSFHDA